MQKIPTVFRRNPELPAIVTGQFNPEATWLNEALFHEPAAVEATVLKTGTPVSLAVHEDHDGKVRVSRVMKRTGEGQVNASQKAKADEPIFAAIKEYAAREGFAEWPEGSHDCEVIEVDGQPRLYPFSLYPERVTPTPRPSYVGLKALLGVLDAEGIVWRHANGAMCKIKRTDLGLPWPPEKEEKDA